ncbi:RRM motif-containing protein [Moesziomyces antarcticus T-34]|uniref:RRM motif-containing protein n=1 Tax=Pseudozyma antarctica (strain T-34) TaxID=1151754 RepID=M9MDX1_PSEA3|nr:RRM motif-containing protein [Moesziomyces antarcticus T-34]
MVSMPQLPAPSTRRCEPGWPRIAILANSHIAYARVFASTSACIAAASTLQAEPAPLCAYEQPDRNAVHRSLVEGIASADAFSPWIKPQEHRILTELASPTSTFPRPPLAAAHAAVPMLPRLGSFANFDSAVATASATAIAGSIADAIARLASPPPTASPPLSPLEEIIAARPKRAGAGRTSQRGRKGGRSGRPSAKAAAVGAGAQNAAVIAASNRNKPPVVIPGRSANTGSKIILSNLPLDVTEAQVKELFSTTIGPLRKVAMSYRANGQSTGVCTVEFQRADDAGRAYTQYNNRLIDGKAPQGRSGRGPRQGRCGASSCGSGAKREARPKKTVEDLDAEMEDYNKQGSTDAAPAA